MNQNKKLPTTTATTAIASSFANARKANTPLATSCS